LILSSAGRQTSFRSLDNKTQFTRVKLPNRTFYV